MRAADWAIAELVQSAARSTASEHGSAERAWTAALSAILLARHLEHPVDLLRVLEMIVVGALDRPRADIRSALDPDNGLHAFALLLELENAGTSEARLVHALVASGSGRAVPVTDRFLGRFLDAMSDEASLNAAG